MYRYHPHYFALFYLRNVNNRLPVVTAVEASSCAATIYEATNSLLVILMGRTHPEDVTRLLDELHLISRGLSLIAPAVSKLASPPRSNIFLERMNVSGLPQALIQSMLDQDDVFALLDINQKTLWTLSAHRTSLFHDPAAAETESIARLAFTASREEATRPRQTRPSKPYDPIASRTSELVNQTIPAIDGRLVELASKWQTLLNEEPPLEITEARSRLKHSLEVVESATRSESPEILMTALLSSDLAASAYAEQSSQLLKALDDYGPGRGNYLDHGSSLILKCIRALADETATRLGISEEIRIFPFFEDSYAVFSDLFERSISGKRVVPLTVARVHQLRLGAVPLTSYLVSSMLESESSPQFLIRLIESNDTEFFRQVIKHIDPNWPTDKQQIDRIHQYESLRTFHNTVSVIACDLLACATTGPAYVYAMARFSSPMSIADLDVLSSFARDGWRKGFPPLSERIRWCLGFLKTLELDTNFSSIYFREQDPLQETDFFQWILSKVIQPYSRAEHGEAVGQAKKHLMNGNVISARPSLILNALWDGVVRKTGYVDEMAALTSISDALDQKKVAT